MKCALLKLCTTNVLTVNRSSQTQIKTQLQSNITEGGNICNSKLTETIVRLCCWIILYLITIFWPKQSISCLSFLSISILPSTLWFILCWDFFSFFVSSTDLNRTSDSTQSNSGLPKHSSFSVCLLQCHCSALQWGVASFCRLLQYILQTGLFHQFPLPLLPSRTHITHAACVHAGPG